MLFPEDGPLRTETSRNDQNDITVWIYKELSVHFDGLVSWITYRQYIEWTL